MTRKKSRPYEISDEMGILIEEAYKIFTRPLSGYLTDVCTDCCISPECERLLISTPVRELSRELIYDYLGSVCAEPTNNEIEHFLPRVLELLASYKYIRHSTELILEKCHFEKDTWKEMHIEFMYRYSTQFIKDVLSKDPNIGEMDRIISYIEMFSIAGLQIDHLLKLWEFNRDDIALKHFEKFMYYDTKNYESYITFSGNSKFVAEINQWINSPKTAGIFLPLIENYCFAGKYEDDIEKYRFEALYDILECRVNN